jgi:hypothetical protein
MINENKIYSTDGTEFLSVATKKEYTGLYHYSLTLPYMGIDNPRGETLLAPIRFGVEAIEFTELNPYFGQHLDDPKSFRPKPLKKDYILSRLTRYFVKNLYTGVIFEVSKPTYNIYNKKDVTLKNLYTAIKLIWKISGALNDMVSPEGIILRTGIIETNQRTMALHKDKFPELPLILPADDLAKITS